ncbi:MAG: hypothetical protein O2840_04200, partial [bacterium]|nr:hypothetical protein [bacterium]
DAPLSLETATQLSEPDLAALLEAEQSLALLHSDEAQELARRFSRQQIMDAEVKAKGIAQTQVATLQQSAREALINLSVDDPEEEDVAEYYNLILAPIDLLILGLLNAENPAVASLIEYLSQETGVEQQAIINALADYQALFAAWRTPQTTPNARATDLDGRGAHREQTSRQVLLQIREVLNRAEKRGFGAAELLGQILESSSTSPGDWAITASLVAALTHLQQDGQTRAAFDRVLTE